MGWDARCTYTHVRCTLSLHARRAYDACTSIMHAQNGRATYVQALRAIKKIPPMGVSGRKKYPLWGKLSPPFGPKGRTQACFLMILIKKIPPMRIIFEDYFSFSDNICPKSGKYCRFISKLEIFLTCTTHEMHFILPHFEHNLPILGKLCSFLGDFMRFEAIFTSNQGFQTNYCRPRIMNFTSISHKIAYFWAIL